MTDAGTDENDLVVEHRTPEAAFELVAHEMRFEILSELMDADGGVSFADLRERVGVRDSGQFNYHLSKLVGTFVEHHEDAEEGTAGKEGEEREREAGYALTTAGARLVGAVLSGSYTKRLDADPVPMDAACLDCGAPMETRLADDDIRVVCTACDLTFTDVDVPPAALEDWPRAAAPAVVDRWLKRMQATVDYGFCPNCDGRVDQRLVLSDEPDAPDWLDDPEAMTPAVVHGACRRCGTDWQSLPHLVVLTAPAVVAFHHDHGVDVRETPLWDFEWLDPESVAVVERDPLAVAVPIPLGDERLVVTVDRAADVVATRREPVG